jgi:lysine-N-methylase
VVTILETKLSFYDEFNCIADKCPMTCCMQWKIAVDDTTYEEWKSVAADEQLEGRLGDYVTYIDSDRVIKLKENKKCPFLDKAGLCSLVLKYGEEILSDTCDTFPRQIHEFAGRTEYALVSCCPAVVDFLKDGELKLITRTAADEENSSNEAEEILFNVRALIMDIISDKEKPVPKAILLAYYVLLDIYDGYGKAYDKKFLTKLYNKISGINVDFKDKFTEDNELWLDMVDNYRKQGLYKEYIEDVCELAEKFENECDFEKIEKSYADFENYICKYENLFRNYLLLEIFADLFVPEADIESLVVMFQWICMEYVMVRHSLFLMYMKCAENREKERLNYDIIREIIVVVSRMTGYDEDDIYEYMANSFQSVVWKWGYMALIIGIGGNI